MLTRLQTWSREKEKGQRADSSSFGRQCSPLWADACSWLEKWMPVQCPRNPRNWGPRCEVALWTCGAKSQQVSAEPGRAGVVIPGASVTAPLAPAAPPALGFLIKVRPSKCRTEMQWKEATETGAYGLSPQPECRATSPRPPGFAPVSWRCWDRRPLASFPETVTDADLSPFWSQSQVRSQYRCAEVTKPAGPPPRRRGRRRPSPRQRLAAQGGVPRRAASFARRVLRAAPLSPALRTQRWRRPSLRLRTWGLAASKRRCGP